MPKKLTSSYTYLRYIPADLKRSKKSGWRIVYSCEIPDSGGKMKQYVEKFNRIKDLEQRKLLAHKRILKINLDLANGWNPMIENQFKKKEQETELANKVFEKVKDLLIQSNVISTANQKVTYGNRLIDDLDYVLKLVKPPVLAEKSYNGYRSNINKIIDYLFTHNQKDILSNDFNKQIAEQFLFDEAEQNELANSGYNNVKRKCSAVFTRLVEKDRIAINPFFGIKDRKETETKINIWHPADLDKYFKYCKKHDHEMYLASLLLFQSYVRPIELGRIKKEHIYPDNYIADIHVRKGKKYKIGPASLSEELAELFRIRIESMSSKAFVFSYGLKPGMKQIGSSSFEKRFNKIKKKLNFSRPEAVFYELKHTGVSIMVANKVPIYNIQQQCRHDSVTTTEVYLRRLNRVGDSYFKNFPSLKKAVSLYSG